MTTKHHMIAIVDYGMGNIRSLHNALQFLGSDVEVTSNPRDLRRAARIILPGVGAFGDAVDAIRARGLDESLDAEVRQRGKPMLGICLGMQLVAMSSTEHGLHVGLGWFNSRVERFELPPPTRCRISAGMILNTASTLCLLD